MERGRVSRCVGKSECQSRITADRSLIAHWDLAIFIFHEHIETFTYFGKSDHELRKDLSS